MKQYKNTPYFITETGEVYRNGKRLKPLKDRGYLRLCIYSNNKRYFVGIHRLVAELYVSNPENKCCVNHINGDKTDNRVKNLEWVNNIQNNNHSLYILGNHFIGEKNGQSKLTEEQVKWIRNLYIPRDRDYGQKALSELFNVNKATIYRVIHNKTWSHI